MTAALKAAAPSSSAICSQADRMEGTFPELKDSANDSMSSTITGPMTG